MAIHKGKTVQRGYGPKHKRARKAYERLVKAGLATCARCQRPIIPGSEWDLDHADDRLSYIGPSHRACNRATAGPPRARPNEREGPPWRGPNGERWSRDWGGGTFVGRVAKREN